MWLLAAPLLLLVAYVASLGPKWAVAFLMGAIVFGFSEKITLGSFDLRVPDLFYVILFGWALVIRARGGQRGYLIGRPLLALWFVALGLSLYPLLLQGDIGVDGLIPWLRLLATFSLVWLVPYALRTRRDVHFALGGTGRSGDRRGGEGGRRRGAPRAGVDPARGNVGSERDRSHRRVGGDPRDPRAGTATALASHRHVRGRRRRPAHDALAGRHGRTRGRARALRLDERREMAVGREACAGHALPPPARGDRRSRGGYDPAAGEPSRLRGVPLQQHGAPAPDGGRRTPDVRPQPDHRCRLAALAGRGALG